MLISGVRFKKVNTATLRRTLCHANGIPAATTSTLHTIEHPTPVLTRVKDVTQEQYLLAETEELSTSAALVKDSITATFSKIKTDSSQDDYTLELLTLLSNVSDIPQVSLDVSKSIEELGIDSLMTTEILGEIQKKLHVTVSSTDFQNFQNLQHLCRYVSNELSKTSSSQSPQSLPMSDESSTSYATTPPPSTKSQTPVIVPSDGVELQYVELEPLYTKRVFQRHQDSFEKHASENGFSSFYTKVYPKQLQLVISYILQALSNLGCDIAYLSVGETLPKVQVLDKHKC